MAPYVVYYHSANPNFLGTKPRGYKGNPKYTVGATNGRGVGGRARPGNQTSVARFAHRCGLLQGSRGYAHPDPRRWGRRGSNQHPPYLEPWHGRLGFANDRQRNGVRPPHRSSNATPFLGHLDLDAGQTGRLSTCERKGARVRKRKATQVLGLVSCGDSERHCE